MRQQNSVGLVELQTKSALPNLYISLPLTLFALRIHVYFIFVSDFLAPAIMQIYLNKNQ